MAPEDETVLPDPGARVRIPESTLHQDLEGEAVLLSLETGTYFTLNEVGSRIWSGLEAGLTLDAIHASLAREYDVAPERLREDLLLLVRDLEERKLIEVHEVR